LTVLASSSPAAGQVVTGVLGFLVVAAMGVALFFLLRSMNKQLRKVAREPRWREEAQAGQDAEQDQPEQDQPEQDYSQNGSPQA
jgi:large-conductance mechanosensitive channel